MIDTIVFDMDGVIVDSEVHWKQVEAEFLGGLIPGWSAKDQHSILGMSAYDVHMKLVRDYGVTMSVKEYFDYYNALSKKIYGERSALIPGSTELIHALHVREVPLALCSSSPREWIDIVLDRFSLRELFRVVVSASDVKGRGKPAPDIYLHTLKQLGSPAESTAAIEDSQKGVQSAKSAGLTCFGFRNGFNGDQDLSAADAIVEGFSGLTPERLLSAERRI